jgi:nitrite reductase (NO-forming)
MSATKNRTIHPSSLLGSRSLPQPSSGWKGAVARLLFGVVFAVDAVMKWMPGYRHSFLDQLNQTAQGQPAFLHGWFHFWISLQSKAPTLFATLTGLTETALALVLLLGVARRAGYTLGIVYMLLVWSVGEGFGGPYQSGATDIGTAIPYVIAFIALLVFSPPARRERLSLDAALVKRFPRWRFIAEPHAVDRVHGAPLVEPVVVGENMIPGL